jgi:hypothetical protein
MMDYALVLLKNPIVNSIGCTWIGILGLYQQIGYWEYTEYLRALVNNYSRYKDSDKDIRHPDLHISVKEIKNNIRSTTAFIWI